MRVRVDGTELWFDVRGAGLRSHAARVRPRLAVLHGHGHVPWLDHPDRYRPLPTSCRAGIGARR